MSIPERLAESLLSNPRADRVRTVAGLARRSARSKQGLFLAEGPQNVREALVAHVRSGSPALALDPAPDTDRTTTTPPHPSALLPSLDALYVTETCLERHPDIAQLVTEVLDGAGNHRVFIRLVTEEVLAVIADAQTPQGAVAVCKIPTLSLSDVLSPSAALVPALCRVQDPGNAGTIIRAADAAGADAVVLTSGSVDLYNPKTVRSTAGSLFHLPVLPNLEFTDLVETATAEGHQILAADGYAALNLDELQDAAVVGAEVDCDLAAPTVWLLGNESQGLSAQEKQAAAFRIAVPLYGQAESLNVGTAATLCLYASARVQRRGSATSSSTGHG
ncbi:TrmH family RNA methyltransferase [Kocuria sp.]|uniref:TrmH family RNA methyltransferase n=1 Tax=Kocuria sp. TaxID=1871328 RepID=UPI0026DFF6FD|nr:RNA methyltransferase [Kocuria sp.]MDO5618714.1 RNA methyltransferase [Kocuria sp.]